MRIISGDLLVFENEGLLPQCVCFFFFCRALMEHNPGAVILSTDDYFTHNGDYQFNPNALGDAHEWNHKRGKTTQHQETLLSKMNTEGQPRVFFDLL